jgi:hypothetical protein
MNIEQFCYQILKIWKIKMLKKLGDIFHIVNKPFVNVVLWKWFHNFKT